LVDAHNKKTAGAKKRGTLRGWKAWILRGVMIVLAPALFLLLVEAVLWMVGFGRETAFFVERESGGQTVHAANEEFCLQFVPRNRSRSPEEVVLSAKRGDSTVRVFVLGGSAAAGDPNSDFGFSRILEAMLNELSQERSFEVVNAAVTSMNSHVARRIAADCSEHGPDAFIVYMGNNEVVGPYGPRSLPAWLYGSTTVIRTIIALGNTRTGQFIASFGKDPPARKWQGMEAFLKQEVPFDDSALSDCYEHFEVNLGDIIHQAAIARAGVVLCTVPTNIRSCPPFGSQHARGLPAEAITRWRKLFDEGRQLHKNKRFDEATQKYQAASEIDDAHAELAFVRGKCAEAGGDLKIASKYYTQARDRDTLRFRADSRINAILRRQAAASDSTSVALADLETELSLKSPGKLLGRHLLLDHVHLNFRGNFLAALTAAKALGKVVPQAKVNIPSVTDDIDALEKKLRRRLMHDTRAIYDLAVLMYRRKTCPPFVGQLDYATEMDVLRRDIIELRKDVRRNNPARFESEYLAIVAEVPGDSILAGRLGAFQIKYGRIDQAILSLRECLTKTSHSLTVRRKFAVALAHADQFDQAVSVLTSQDNPFVWGEKRALEYIGTELIKNGQPMKSENLYKKALDLDSDSVDALVNLGAMAIRKGRIDEAEEYLNRALAIDPTRVDAMGNLANSFVKRNDFERAGQWFEKAITSDPYDDLAYLALGAHQLMRQQKISEGVENLKRCIELNPTSAPAYQLLATLYLRQADRATALQYKELADLFSGP
jgi:tetratricopeptide (TPR) repeat protein